MVRGAIIKNKYEVLIDAYLQRLWETERHERARERKRKRGRQRLRDGDKQTETERQQQSNIDRKRVLKQFETYFVLKQNVF